MGLTQGGFVGTPAFASPEQFSERAGGCSLGHLFVRRDALVSAHRPQAFRRRDHRTDSREPALASSTDRTAEGSTCSKPPCVAAGVDACGRTGSAPGCPCTHVAIARLPRPDPQSLESGAPIGSCGRSDRDRGCGLRAVPSVAQPSHVPERGACKYLGEKHRRASIRKSERRSKRTLTSRRACRTKS